MIRLNLVGVLTIDRGGGLRLDGHPIVDLDPFAGKSIVLTMCEVCGVATSRGPCTLGPHGPDRNHVNLLEI